MMVHSPGSRPRGLRDDRAAGQDGTAWSEGSACPPAPLRAVPSAGRRKGVDAARILDAEIRADRAECEGEMSMEAAQSDALVFFGASGDLAFKQIFPALLGLVGDEGVNVPIVGVAKSGWKVDDLKARAKASIESHGGADPAKLARLLGLLRYVDGDYGDPGTFAALKQALGPAKRPLHYLAIPPSLFGVVVDALATERAQRKRAPGRRETVRPRPRIGAGAQSDPARAFSGAGDLSHRSLSRARSRFRASSTPGSRTRRSSRCGTATMCAASRSPWRKRLGSTIAAASTTQRARSATWCRTTCFRCSPT